MAEEKEDPRVELAGKLHEAFFGTLTKREPDTKDKDGNPVSSVRRPKHADNGWRNGHSHPVTFSVSPALKARLADAGFVVSEEIPAPLLKQLQAAGTPIVVMKGERATFDRQPMKGTENLSVTLYNALLAAIEAGDITEVFV